MWTQLYTEGNIEKYSVGNCIYVQTKITLNYSRQRAQITKKGIILLNKNGNYLVPKYYFTSDE